MKFRFVAVVISSVCMVLVSTGCSTLADAKAGKGTGTSQTFAVASDRVWQVLPAAVKSAGLVYVTGNKDEGFALAQRGVTAFSYGENVAIFIDKLTSESTKVEVVSKKALATNVFAPDWASPILDKITESFTQMALNTTAPAITDAHRQEADQAKSQLEQERLRVAEERRRLEEDKRQQAKQTSRMSITATATQPDSSGVVTINIQTNTDTSSLKINGEELGGKPVGSYSVKKVVRVGQETKFNIVGIDVNGNVDSKTIAVFRQAAESKVVFGQLNAANVKQQPARDAVAIIIGIEKYKRVAKADFANADAQVFYDYASRALGIKQENIKLLVDDGADDAEIYRAFQNWLPLKVKKGKTEVFVFFSGHGLPSQDGKSLYLLPWGVDKDFVEKTAINQKEIIASLQAVHPKSVTMFIDSCYSGQARGGETLVASARPIALKVAENVYPPNFTVISASAPDQLSSSSPDLKHGIFSYYLMKGMEGDADQNKDGKVTVGEMQEYLTYMVGRQAIAMNRKQQPHLFGDADRVLVGR